MALEQLNSLTLTREIQRPGTEAYNTSNGSYFTVFESEIKPSCIVQPTTAEEVSAVINQLRPALVNNEVKLAIRGTGHTPFAGSANIEGGVTLDLRFLKGISLSGDKSVVKISVGETWTSVYEELEKHGLATAGGRVGRVGVAGLTLGGGLSMYSSQRGFACDSVTEFEIVLASGNIVRANSTDNADLFTSLKGGLNNFGIVTCIHMKTFPSSKMWGGLTCYMPTAYEAMAKAIVDFALNETDKDTHIIPGCGFGQGHEMVTCCMYQTQGIENAPSLQRFTEIEGQIPNYKTMRTSSHMDFCNELSNFMEDGVRSFYATCTIRPDVDLLNEFHSIWTEILEPLKNVASLRFSLGFLPLTKSLLQVSKQSGGNAKDIDPEDGSLLVVLINPLWGSSDDDERMQNGVRELLKRYKQAAADKGLLHRYLFTNYGYQEDDIFLGYGEESLERMREVSRKYDPERIFQDAVPGGFKLWKK